MRSLLVGASVCCLLCAEFVSFLAVPAFGHQVQELTITHHMELAALFSFGVCVAHGIDGQQSNKHILNQPPDLCVELIKNMTNPASKQWSWVARNLHLRTSLFLGSPSEATPRPQAMDASDI